MDRGPMDRGPEVLPAHPLRTPLEPRFKLPTAASGLSTPPSPGDDAGTCTPGRCDKFVTWLKTRAEHIRTQIGKELTRYSNK